MTEEVSDERNTRYFQVHRTQPFLITFVQALMAFKRVAKVMKIVFARRAMKKEKTLSNSMKQIIRRSTQDVISASHGAPVITMSAEEMKHHRYLVKLRKKVSASEAAPNSVPKVSSPITKSKVHLPMHMGDKLKKILVVTAEPSFKETADTGAGVGTGLHNLMQKNAAIQDAENKYVREYVPGTVIYYGSTIAIQARHGGYLSFNDPKNIKASAHKVMPHSRYIVSNANDATYTGAIKYGDAVMLQAGQHEVLGAQFTGTPQQGETSRKIKPALINFRKENSQRAQSVSFLLRIMEMFWIIFPIFFI